MADDKQSSPAFVICLCEVDIPFSPMSCRDKHASHVTNRETKRDRDGRDGDREGRNKEEREIARIVATQKNEE